MTEPRIPPEHPAARTVFDEQGRPIELGMSEAEMRLQCMQAICSSSGSPLPARVIIRHADLLFRYAMTGIKPEPETEPD